MDTKREQARFGRLMTNSPSFPKAPQLPKEVRDFVNVVRGIEQFRVRVESIIPPKTAKALAAFKAFQMRMEPFARLGELMKNFSDDQASSPTRALAIPGPGTRRLPDDQLSMLIAAIRNDVEEIESECWFDRRTGSVHLWDCEPIPVRNVGAVHEQFERLFSPVGRSVTLATIGGVYATGHESLRAEFHRHCPEVLRPALRGKGRGGTCFDLEALREIAAELQPSGRQ